MSLYLEIQLYLFREKMRPIEAMVDAMKGIGNEDLVTLAKLIARLPPPKPEPPDDLDRMRRGQILIHRHAAISATQRISPGRTMFRASPANGRITS